MNKISIYGGLGNQMFQYSLCAALQNRGNKSEISIADFFYIKHHNGFELRKAFHIKFSYALRIQIFLLTELRYATNNKIAIAFFKRFIPLFNKRQPVYKEKKEFIYDEEIFNQYNTLLIGTWQSESYLNNIRQVVLKDFDFKYPSDEKNMELINIIKKNNSISIHVRRGDYIKPEWQKTHAVIKGKTYYNNSINYINNRIENPHYFIFSDDMQWVKNNLYFNNCTYVENNTKGYSYIDMLLMSLCKHNIIANSTFSWWGAWLNKNKDKIVIMPSVWLNNVDCSEIFPEDWIKMEV